MKGDPPLQGQIKTALYSSPVGSFYISSNTREIIQIQLTCSPKQVRTSDPAVCRCIQELSEYFAGKRSMFDVPVSLHGLPRFSQKILKTLRTIPFGKTISYGALAEKAGSPNAARAVGSIMHRNPVPFIYPCHRVIACGGRIGGFGMGLEVKRKLFEIEGIIL